MTASVKWGTHLLSKRGKTCSCLLAWSSYCNSSSTDASHANSEYSLMWSLGILCFSWHKQLYKFPEDKLWVCALCQWLGGCQWWQQTFQTPSLTPLTLTWLCVAFPKQSLAQSTSESPYSSAVLRTKGLEMHHRSNSHRKSSLHVIGKNMYQVS